MQMGNCVSEVPVQSQPNQQPTGQPAGQPAVSQSMFQSMLQLLSGVQIIVGVDCSGSMGAHCGRPGDYRTRSRFVHDLIGPFLQQIMDIDTDGVDMIFYGSFPEHYKVNSNSYQNIIHLCERNMGGTDTAAVFKMMYEIHQDSGSQKTIGIVITDGSPNSEAECFGVIDMISRSVKSTSEFNILVLRVGEDQGAKTFLERLDNFRVDGDNTFDVVDTGLFSDVFASSTSIYEALSKCIFD